MNALSRAFATINAPKPVPQYTKLCNVIVTKMTGNTNFPTPPVALIVVAGHLSDLEKADEAAQKGPKGAAQDRNVKLGLVRSDMRQLKAYVQSVADANMAEAKAIIVSAGFDLAKRSDRSKPPFAIRYGKVPGSAMLQAKAVDRRTTYYWQMSVDQKAWSDLPDTHVASATASGLTAATVYYFRFRTLTAAGLSDWSVIVSLIAH